jgi:hypothetical protein
MGCGASTLSSTTGEPPVYLEGGTSFLKTYNSLNEYEQSVLILHMRSYG